MVKTGQLSGTLQCAVFSIKKKSTGSFCGGEKQQQQQHWLSCTSFI